jgi:hypothetical protein
MASPQARQAPGDQANVTQAGFDQAATEFRAVADSSRLMARGWTELMQSWLEFMERSATSQAQLVRDMFLGAPMQQGLQAQQSFLQDNLRNFAEGTSMVLRSSGLLAEQAARPLAQLAELRGGARPAERGDHERAQRPGERRRVETADESERERQPH